MTLRAAAEQALDTLEHVQAHIGRYDPPVVTTIARAMQPTIDALRAALAAEQPQPEPSEAEVAAAMASLHRDMEPAAWPSEDEVTDALRAAAAARGR